MDKWRPAIKANLTVICERLSSRKCGSLDFTQLYGLPLPVTGIALPLYLPIKLTYTPLLRKRIPRHRLLRNQVMRFIISSDTFL
jgi:hypothetical protein